MSVDPTRIDIQFDPTVQRMKGIAYHGETPFDVPYVTEIAPNLWQGGCKTGLVLPTNINHIVSLYPWERYRIQNNDLKSETYVRMYDSLEQGFDEVDALARWINLCRLSGPVLVHCQAGLNRSSLVAARALWSSGLGDGNLVSGDEIVEHLRATRSPAVLCNPAFELEVRSWQA